MTKDTPTRKLQEVINLLVGTRGLGRAARIRLGYEPYASELDFRNVDEATGVAKVAWASEQAPYADMHVLPGSAATGTLTVYVHVDTTRLALYLTEHVLIQATGQTWATATGALPALAKRIINETAGAPWTTLLTRMQAAQASLYGTISLLEGDASQSPAAGVLIECLQQAVTAEAQVALLTGLRGQANILTLIGKALETGEYLAGA
jgi:hypothetical protein